MTAVNPKLGFNPTDAIVAIEYRAPDLNAHNPRIAQQNLASDTRQGRILQGVNTHDGVTAVLVDAAKTDNGQIRRWYTLDARQSYGLALHEAPAGKALQLSAWRLRNLLLEGGDPTAFADGLGYNSHGIRQRLATRPGVLALLDAIKLSDAYRIPSTVAQNGQIAELTGSQQVFIKPFAVSDVSERDPHFRAQLFPNNKSEIEAQVLAIGGQAILQPRLQTMAAKDLIGAIGIKPSQSNVPSDSLHTVRMYDFLWLNEDPTVAEIRLTNPRDNIGALYATRSYLLEGERVRAAFPNLAALHHKVRQRLRVAVGKPGNLAMNYLILPDGTAKIVSIDARAFTPDLTDPDPHRQALSRSLAAAEAEQLVMLAGEHHRPSLTKS